MSDVFQPIPVETKSFPNGFRIIYQRSPINIPLSSIQVFCNVGSAFEIDHYRGIAHMVEHMAFKGTKKLLPKEIFAMFDKIGSYFNAYTNKRFTCYTIKCASTYTEYCLKTLSEMLFHSTFPRKEYDKEVEVVIEENIRDNNDPSSINHDMFCKIAYDGTTFQYAVDSVDYHKHKYSLEDIKQWYANYYQPKNMIISIVSTLPFSTILKSIQKTSFMQSKSNYLTTRFGLTFPQNHLPKTIKQNIVCKTKVGMTNTNIMIGFPTYHYHDDRMHHMTIIKYILNGMSGRLFQILREKNPLTYRVFADVEHNEFGGFFAIDIETSNDKLFTYHLENVEKKGVIPLVLDIFKDLREHGITTKELHLAKTQIRNSQLIDFQDIDHFCKHNGEYLLLYNKPFVSFHHMYDVYIKPIQVEDVNESIKQLFTREHIIVTIISNSKHSSHKVEQYVHSF
jgi:predicted Zn-dependent peptidase